MRTIEEVNEEMLKLNNFIYNKIKFVPFNEIEYKLGYINKVILDKRTNTILLEIISLEGENSENNLTKAKKYYKTPNAKYLEILEEKVNLSEKNIKITKDILLAKISKLEEENQNLLKIIEELKNK